jgi:hypothetical protein
MIPKNVTIALVILIGFVWAANFFAQFIVAGYKPEPSVNGLFGTLVGILFAISKRGSGSGESEGSDGD